MSIVSEFRAGLARGELLLQHCKSCDKLNMYPRHACPHCQSTALDWKRSAGRGKIHSFSVLRMGAPEGFDADLPYAVAVVKLEEGVQLMARLAPEADGDWLGYECDGPVEFAPMPPASVEQRPCAWFKKPKA